MEGRIAPSNEIDLRFSRVADRLAAVEKVSVLHQKPPPTARVSQQRHKQVKKIYSVGYRLGPLG